MVGRSWKMKRSGFLLDQGTPGDWRHFRPLGPTLGMFEKGKRERGKRNKTEHRYMWHAAKMKYFKSSKSLANILGVVGSRSKRLENVSRLKPKQGPLQFFLLILGGGGAPVICSRPKDWKHHAGTADGGDRQCHQILGWAVDLLPNFGRDISKLIQFLLIPKKQGWPKGPPQKKKRISL